MSITGNDPVVATQTTINWTVAAIDAWNDLIWPIITIFAVYLANKYVKDKDAKATIQQAIVNSQGWAIKVGDGMITRANPAINMNLPPDVATRLQYVLNHADDDIKRIYKTVSPTIEAKLAEKVVRQQGLEENAARQAAAAPTITTQVTADPPGTTVTIAPPSPPSSVVGTPPPTPIPVTSVGGSVLQPPFPPFQVPPQ